MTDSTASIIRPFKAEDYESVTRILVHSFHPKFDVLTNLDTPALFEFIQFMNVETSIPRDGLYVAELDSEVAGILSLRWKDQIPPLDTPEPDLVKAAIDFGLVNVLRFSLGMFILEEELPLTDCYIEHIAVAESCRGKGIGKQLLAFANDFARERKFKRLTLNVAVRNQGAVALYQQLGFKIERQINSLMSQLVLREKSFYFMTKSLLAEPAISTTENQ